MSFNYEVYECQRCGEHFKIEGSSSSVDALFGAEHHQRFNMGYMGESDAAEGTFCPSCKSYRERAIERAKRLAERESGGTPSFVECPRCNGNGSIGGITCPKCEGNGRIKNRSGFLNSLYTDTSESNFEKYKQYLPSDFNKK
ncbi:MAG TPA: hypothetical protein VMC07_02365 [Candidatus Omnitrophota bacterium]|nr:hypothetical protein [Candidatus Omnitrophota bacterium]